MNIYCIASLTIQNFQGLVKTIWLNISLEKLIQICLNKSRAFHLVKYLCCKEEALKGPKPFESKRQLILVKSLVRPIPQQFHQFHSSPRPSCSIPQLIIDQVHTFKLLFFVLVWIGVLMVLFRLSETVLLVPQELLAMVVRVWMTVPFEVSKPLLLLTLIQVLLLIVSVEKGVKLHFEGIWRNFRTEDSVGNKLGIF